MRASWRSKAIVFILIISLFVSLFEAPLNNRAYAEEQQESSSSLTSAIVSERFDVSKEFVQSEVDTGLLLSHVYSILYRAEQDGMTYEEAKSILLAPEVNESQTVTSEVKNAELPVSLVLQELKPNNSEEENMSQGGLENKASASSKSAAAAKPPTKEEPPVYTKESMSQAPYSVNLNNEVISSLSGSLMTGMTDMSLPGRNGMSFNLTRQYSSDDSAFFDMDYSIQYYPVTINFYYVSFYATRKYVSYDIMYNEKSFLQYDYNGDGLPDDSSFIPSHKSVLYGNYPTNSQATQVLNQGITYTIAADSRMQTTSRTSSTNSFPASVSYSQDGYTGTLTKQGTSSVISGSYIPADSKTQPASCSRKKYGSYNSSGVWVKTSEDPECPSTYPYNSGGYSGNLPRTTTTTVNECPATGKANTPCTGHWIANYSGTVTRPASDTRVWQQNYQGQVIKPGSSSKTKTSSWRSIGNGRYERDVYEITSAWIDPRESTGESTQRTTVVFLDYEDALSELNRINASVGAFVESSNGYNYYISSNPAPTIVPLPVGEEQDYRYINTTKQPLNEKLYPIGKGWSWKLPHVEINGSKQKVYLADGGSYDVENGNLKDYTWLGLSFKEDTTVSVNGESSKYVLSTVDEMLKQYFTSDGRIIQMKDAYNNTISFHYAQNATYNRKLLSQVSDSIGNSINITYTTTNVILTKGTEKVVYEKRTENGKELLDAVTDQEGRRTTYSYNLAPAKFNLMGFDENRAISNPYALLSKINHPTGAITEYTYETAPVKRYMGSSSFMEAYRISARADRLQYSDGSSMLNNYHTITYNGDYLKSHGKTETFSSTLFDGLTSTLFNYKKEFINNNQPVQFYLESQSTSAEGWQKTTTNTYTKKVGTRNYAVNSPTTIISSDNKTSDTLTTTIQYDDYGNVISSVDPSGATTTYTYDATKKWLKNSLQQVDTNQYLYTEYIRNAKGDIVETFVRKNNSTGEVLSYIYKGSIDAHGNFSTVNIANGSKMQLTIIEYDSTYRAFPSRQITLYKDAYGIQNHISKRFEYNKTNGQLIAYVDGNDARTTYDLDKIGRITRVTHPDNTSLIAEYNDLQNIVTVTDEMGRKLRTVYNGLGWKSEEGIIGKNGYEVKLRTDHDQNGRALWVEDAFGNRNSFQYDAWGRSTKTISPNKSETVTSYNDSSREVLITDAVGNTSIEVFDKFGRSIRSEEKLANGSRKIMLHNSYNLMNGLLQQQTDANQATTIFSYDILGQLTAVTNSKGEVTRYSYDQLGQHIKTTFPDGNEVQKVYDELGRLIQSIDSMNQKVTYFYDANSNRSKLVDKKGQTFLYSYNNRNMLLSKQGPTETISFTYYNDGSRKSMTDNTGTTNYGYDPHTGQVTNVAFPDSKVIAYSYNNQGQRVSMTTPFGDRVTYKYNTTNQLSELKWNDLKSIGYSYYSNGQLQKTNSNNTMEAIHTYTNGSLSRLKQETANGELKREYQYNYDNNKNITSISERNNEEVTSDNSFAYDQLNRIQSSTLFNETYSYDNRGNRQTLTTDSAPSLSDNIAYEYDEWDRLTKVTKADGTSVSYRYNGDNLLVERTENGSTIRYYYDGQNIIAEGIVQPDGMIVEKVSYLRGNKLEMLEDVNNQVGYYGYNGHGDVTGIIGADGSVLNEYSYDIWGKPIVEEEEIPNTFRYSGEFWDSSTELQYLRARWYDPITGRFVNEDTYQGDIYKTQTLNYYTYVINNPLKYIDPTGNYCVSADGNWAHAGECKDLQKSYWFPDANQPVVENGYLVGRGGVYTDAYKKANIQFNAWNATRKPTVRDPGPVTNKNSHTAKPIVKEFSGYDQMFDAYSEKIGFSLSEGFGAYTSYSKYKNGFELTFESGDILRFEFSLANINVGFYIDPVGTLFIGFDMNIGMMEATMLQQMQNNYYMASSISVSLGSRSYYIKFENGQFKAHVTPVPLIGFGGGLGIEKRPIK
ncbi:RHS repeat protein [Paenibacillus pinisoli]|uniref:RHS repeat protein n=1 Tax=Paenibacillus pinisoli TaxID=1276110 RepID=A0A3A6PA19_9BACL|nr:RHS repeat-associated core domain-containing protein [Paenibacillus pinisoli]RJX36755.1 RHS repeat protein [Paenibacillus pinisoli]